MQNVLHIILTTSFNMEPLETTEETVQRLINILKNEGLKIEHYEVIENERVRSNNTCSGEQDNGSFS
jgi:hypothetical protein